MWEDHEEGETLLRREGKDSYVIVRDARGFLVEVVVENLKGDATSNLSFTTTSIPTADEVKEAMQKTGEAWAIRERTISFEKLRAHHRRFEHGSTQTPALPEEVARGDFDVACRDEWLKNIVGKGVLGRVVDRKEVDSVMQIGWRLTWKEKETQQVEKEKEENRQEEEKAAQSRQTMGKGDRLQYDREGEQP
uniref:Uncharacterized protein n=1 Tax=Chromera velia CCMP2878 TaxID=1169474 RepID=A0A0G4FAW7_9ALVE|eukprot:Cvel_16063.t1-p1 / transcript=Cvel_16063.t1 / gene=Cvel_16063 / organism=Chromera_velia_CCMP2878 / gene_product=hypothetical protein / transcript_product=hypothetical protein / location=Cvel_scaffold1221:7487-9014(-) / protein_length=191 / sequence_SO=supercontig / SO=protein_coding / is_pseudo=false